MPFIEFDVTDYGGMRSVLLQICGGAACFTLVADFTRCRRNSGGCSTLRVCAM
ncbi:hypothetical protein DL95DRAFT_387547 [Leptodontidium sp. 2 PMI_412]|nr:hypothetical protein DL95DRAFT_387547 [Leptodontidium sp. 2 PMI_412]